MKKFKAFGIIVDGSKHLTIASQKHACDLGYCHLVNGEYKTYDFIKAIGFYNNGTCAFYSDAIGLAESSNDNILTLDEFFALTPEDMVVEPERFDCELRIETPLYSKCLASQCITQSQIDEIKAIMERES